MTRPELMEQVDPAVLDTELREEAELLHDTGNQSLEARVNFCYKKTEQYDVGYLRLQPTDFGQCMRM